MSQLRLNIAANFASRIWTTLLSLGLVPIYIHFLGMEAYGLIGFFASLQVLLNLLDFGLSATMSREMARYSTWPDQAQTMRDLVRTLEGLYWGIGAIIGGGLVVLAPFIAQHWLKAEHLSASTLEQAVLLIGIINFLQWPLSFYSGGLLGLQKQVALNAVNIVAATVKGVGSVLLLGLFSPTVLVFFGWQVVVSAVQVSGVTWLLWRSLPGPGLRPRFRLETIRTVWRFAAGMSATSMIVLLLGQLDKLILSAILPLEHFGYYVLASTLASALGIPPAPVTDALFPRYVQLMAIGDETALRKLFHQGCQLISVLVFPAAGVLIFFSREILQLWTRNSATAEAAYLIASIMVLGAALNTLMSMLDGVQIAAGWLKPAFFARVGAILLLVPLMLWLAPAYGGVGAAFTWLAVYGGYILIVPHFVYRRLLRGEKWRWYAIDTCLPLFVALSIAALWRWAIPPPAHDWQMLVYLGGAGVASLAAVVVVLPQARPLLWNEILQAMNRFSLASGGKQHQ